MRTTIPEDSLTAEMSGTQPHTPNKSTSSNLKQTSGADDTCAASQPESKFAEGYQKGMNKLNYWDPVYEDSLNLIAKLPGIAATIYRNSYKGGKLIPHDPNLDWAANLSHMMGARTC
jgi:citrate synthase